MNFCGCQAPSLAKSASHCSNSYFKQLFESSQMGFIQGWSSLPSAPPTAYRLVPQLTWCFSKSDQVSMFLLPKIRYVSKAMSLLQFTGCSAEAWTDTTYYPPVRHYYPPPAGNTIPSSFTPYQNMPNMSTLSMIISLIALCPLPSWGLVWHYLVATILPPADTESTIPPGLHYYPATSTTILAYPQPAGKLETVLPTPTLCL